MYAADELTQMRGVSVTIFDRLPTPFGLVRAGVAPDHDGTKQIEDQFARILKRPNVTCMFNVEVGHHVEHDEILRHHHAMIWATGAGGDKNLRIPGQDLTGSVTAREFVSWYNGHPDYENSRFDMTSTRAVVIGNGNVALDVARMLTRRSGDLETTSTSPIAAAALRTSNVRQVVVAARRGQAFAAYSTSELMALAQLEEVQLLAHSGEVSVGAHDLTRALQRRSQADLKRRLTIIEQAASRISTAPRSIMMRFGLQPVEFIGNGRVDGVRFASSNGDSEVIETSLVIRATGFTGHPIPGLPWNGAAGTLPNQGGRVHDPVTHEPIRGVYCTGWIKRGATGVIGTNREDANETVENLVADVRDGRLTDPQNDALALFEIVGKRTAIVTKDDWNKIDRAEKAGGPPRVKLTGWQDLLNAAHGE